MNCKLYFPTGYFDNKNHGNHDVNVILEDGSVYFLILITLDNIKYLMGKKDLEFDNYFWLEDMLILSSLELEIIKNAISAIVKTNKIEKIGSYIGEEKDLFREGIQHGDLFSI